MAQATTSFYFAHNTTWTGTVLGGLDTDTVHLYGQAGDMTAAPPTFSGVEILDIASTDSTIVRLTSTQLNAFQQITGFVRADNRVALELGGTANVDFSTKLLPGDTFGVNVMLFAATGSRTYTGTANGDYFRDANNSGSHIDTFVGGAGNDTFLANNSGALAIFDGGNDNDRYSISMASTIPASGASRSPRSAAVSASIRSRRPAPTSAPLPSPAPRHEHNADPCPD